LKGNILNSTIMNFTSALMTDSMEDVNRRIKYELRVPYENLDSIYSRALLALMIGSFYDFRPQRVLVMR
jgi:hypothetical protein